MDSSFTPELDALPQEWRVDRFDRFFFVQQGKQVSKRNRVGNSQRPFLRTKNVLWGRLDLAELDEMHFTDEEESRLALQPGDLLICEGGDIGRTAIWHGAVQQCYTRTIFIALGDGIAPKSIQNSCSSGSGTLLKLEMFTLGAGT